MAGERQMPRPVAPHREQILDRAVGRVANREPVDREAEREQRCLEDVEYRPARWRDAVDAEQCLRESDGIDHAAIVVIPLCPGSISPASRP